MLCVNLILLLYLWIHLLGLKKMPLKVAQEYFHSREIKYYDKLICSATKKNIFPFWYALLLVEECIQSEKHNLLTLNIPILNRDFLLVWLLPRPLDTSFSLTTSLSPSRMGEILLSVNVPWWRRLWVFRLALWEKTRPQNSHSYGFSPMVGIQNKVVLSKCTWNAMLFICIMHISLRCCVFWED